MVCDSWKTKLDTYLDGELRSEETLAFDRHLHSCTTCAADALARLQMKRSIQTAGRRFTPSPEFRRRMQQKIEVKQRSSVFGWKLITAAAMAVVLIIAGLATTYLTRRQNSARLSSEIVDLHVATLASASPVDVISTDRHTVKPWFEGKIPFSFDLPELRNTDFQLLGGRVTYLEQTPGAHLIYQIRKHRLSVFIFPEELLKNRFGSGTLETTQLSFHMQSWSQAGLRYVVISDVGAGDVRSLANLFKSVS
jgi:anti-sigma factor RsiW